MFSFNSLRSLAQDMRRKLGVYSALGSYQVNQQRVQSQHICRFERQSAAGKETES